MSSMNAFPFMRDLLMTDTNSPSTSDYAFPAWEGIIVLDSAGKGKFVPNAITGIRPRCMERTGGSHLREQAIEVATTTPQIVLHPLRIITQRL
jgi:hypothetical protein